MLNGLAYWECMGTQITVQLIFPWVYLFYNFFLTSVSAWFLIVNKASDRGWTYLHCFWLRLRCHVVLLRINNFFIVGVCLLDDSLQTDLTLAIQSNKLLFLWMAFNRTNLVSMLLWIIFIYCNISFSVWGYMLKSDTNFVSLLNLSSVGARETCFNGEYECSSYHPCLH